ncbi:MAG: carbohydrate porin [Rhodocyclaceae bacterium]|nr:carbohydrate porin [Rhodocyclaceae bacterium]
MPGISHRLVPSPRQRGEGENALSRPGGRGLGRGWELSTIALALALVTGPSAASDDMKALLAEVKRLADRVEALEKNNKALEQALATERLSEKEPEVATRLKAVESQIDALKSPAKKLIEATEGISVGASLTAVGQRANREGVAGAASRQSRANYRGDVTVTLPGGEIGDIEGKIFSHIRFGQGTGLGLRPTYTSTPNTTAFETNAGPDDSFAILAQAWYQLTVPLPRDGAKADAREHLHATFGKIDSFVFFDQNAAADDESAKFLNNAFVHNPLLDSGGDIRADAYGFAPGAILQYVNEHDKSRTWGLSLGAFGSGPGANFSGSLGKPYIIGQADTTWRFNHLPGNYRAYLWSNGRGLGYDGIERRHSGIGMSIDQKVSDWVTAFARYGHQAAGKVRFDRALTVGAEIAGNAWGRSADSLGAAFGLLRTSSAYRRDSVALDLDGDGALDPRASANERIAELYYRYRVNERIELTPDFQLIQRPGGDGGAPTIKVVGLRAKVGF